jgi:hypothetical protein
METWILRLTVDHYDDNNDNNDNNNNNNNNNGSAALSFRCNIEIK